MAFEYHNTESNHFGLDIIVITKNDCSQCSALKRSLDLKKIPYRSVNAEEDHETYDEFDGLTAYDYAIGKLKVREMPLVLVNDDRKFQPFLEKFRDDIWESDFDLVWHGMRPDKLSVFRREYASRKKAAES